jgi:RNA polymerase sigma factor (TIGR02999 family)
MRKAGSSHVTALLAELCLGNEAARDELLTLVYPELKRIAARYMRQERPDHTLRTTGLVHEVYVRLFGPHDSDWQSRAHFFAVIAREMRHILVDYARARNAKKRPEGRVQLSLSDVDVAISEPAEDLVALDEALSRLEALNPRAGRVVELRFFAGLGERESAEALHISLSTLKRDWIFAKAWLLDQLKAGDAPT